MSSAISNKILVKSYEDALEIVRLGLTADQIEFPACDLTIKPTDHLRAPVADSWHEGAILTRQAHVLFE